MVSNQDAFLGLRIQLPPFLLRYMHIRNAIEHPQPEIVEDFTLPLNEVDPCVPRVVVNEGDEISAPAKTNVLCQPPYTKMYQVGLVPAPVMLVGEMKSVLLPSWQASQICAFRPLNLGNPNTTCFDCRS